MGYSELREMYTNIDGLSNSFKLHLNQLGFTLIKPETEIKIEGEDVKRVLGVDNKNQVHEFILHSARNHLHKYPLSYPDAAADALHTEHTYTKDFINRSQNIIDSYSKIEKDYFINKTVIVIVSSDLEAKYIILKDTESILKEKEVSFWLYTSENSSIDRLKD